MSYNPDPLKQAQAVIFSSRITKTNDPTLIFNNNPVPQFVLQKHLGIFLDCNLNFEEHLKTIVNNIDKTIGLLRKFENFLIRKSFLTINKSFIRPHLDYDDTIYDQSYNTSFYQRLKSLQYNAALTITGAICGTLIEKLYNELRLKSFQKSDGIKSYLFYTKLLLTNPLFIVLTLSSGKIHLAQLEGQITFLC